MKGQRTKTGDKARRELSSRRFSADLLSPQSCCSCASIEAKRCVKNRRGSFQRREALSALARASLRRISARVCRRCCSFWATMQPSCRILRALNFTHKQHEWGTVKGRLARQCLVCEARAPRSRRRGASHLWNAPSRPKLFIPMRTL